MYRQRMEQVLSSADVLMRDFRHKEKKKKKEVSSKQTEP